jgi:hypothetical protein
MDNEIASLKGEELNVVSFVMDYIEFHFNGPVLRVLTDPSVETPKGRFVFPSAGSRDALCSLIGKEVLNVTAQEEKSVVLEFEGGSKISIPIDEKSYKCAEALHWCPVNGPMQVWS